LSVLHSSLYPYVYLCGKYIIFRLDVHFNVGLRLD